MFFETIAKFDTFCGTPSIHYWLPLDKICSPDPEYITFPNSLKIGKLFHLPI